MIYNRILPLFCGAVAWVLFVFPQIPVQTRFIVPVALGALLLAGRGVLSFRPLQVAGIYVAYIIVAGVFTVLISGDGALGDAVYPLRYLSLAVVVSVFVLNAGPKLILLFSNGLILAETAGIVYDYRVGPVWLAMPFPIFSENYFKFIANRDASNSIRLGGFTFEPGVLGALIALFILVNITVVIADLLSRRRRLGWRWHLFTLVGIGCGVGASFLARTKATPLILAFYGVCFLVALVFIRVRKQQLLRRLAAVLVILGLFGAFGLGYTMATNTDYGRYLNEETDNLYLFSFRGFDRREGRGLNTRIECAKLVLYGLLYHPQGIGNTLGRSWAEPVLNKITMTPDMEVFAAYGRYSGKAYLLNMVMQGGVVGIVLFFAMMIFLYRCFASPRHPDLKVLGFGLCGALVAIGLSVELLPYIELIVFVAGVGVVVTRMLVISEQAGLFVPAPIQQGKLK